MPVSRFLAALLLVLWVGACDDTSGPDPDDRPFLEGTGDDPRIGVVVHSLGRTLGLVQLGDPQERREVPLGASSSVTPVGFSLRGRRALVPLGNAASVALVDLDGLRVDRFFLFSSGNATGSAFVDDDHAVATNLVDDYVARIDLEGAGDEPTETVAVAPAPSTVLVAGGRVLVVSGNLDEEFTPLGPGVVTALDPGTLEVLGTVETGGRNAGPAALGPDGLLYVVNAEDFAASASIAVIDPVTLERVDLIEGVGVGPGHLAVDEEGLAYVSSFSLGTVVVDTRTGDFVRGPEDPVCAPLEGGGCRGAIASTTDDGGRLYQLFFGSPSEGLPPRMFVYGTGDFALTDSLVTGPGPADVRISTF